MAALLLCVGASCSDRATSPRTPEWGVLRVWVHTLGGDPDIDGYDIVADSTQQVFLPGNMTNKDLVLGPGAHTITLKNVAENCSITGAQTQPATVTTHRVTEVVFEVVCAATGVAVTASTSGADHPNTYRVAVDGRALGVVEANGSAVVSRLQAGSHIVSLIVPGSTCRLTGANQIAVEITARSVTPIEFQITCVAPVRHAKIAYQLDTVFNDVSGTAIAVANLDGSDPEILGLGQSPSWAPDGTRLIFSDAKCDYDFYYYYTTNCTGGLVAMDPESWSTTRPPSGNILFNPTWAPTGDAIAATVFGGGLSILKLDGSAATFVPLPGVGLADLTWSPDGRRIAFTCYVGGPSGICIVNRDGTGFTRLTTDTAFVASASDPAWSPDGQRIAFARSIGDIAILTLEGGSVARLTEGLEPAWSPDGSKLVFRSQANFGLFTINADGSNRQRLTTGNHHAPAWRP